MNSATTIMLPQNSECKMNKRCELNGNVVIALKVINLDRGL